MISFEFLLFLLQFCLLCVSVIVVFASFAGIICNYDVLIKLCVKYLTLYKKIDYRTRQKIICICNQRKDLIDLLKTYVKDIDNMNNKQYYKWLKAVKKHEKSIEEQRFKVALNLMCTFKDKDVL